MVGSGWNQSKLRGECLEWDKARPVALVQGLAFQQKTNKQNNAFLCFPFCFFFKQNPKIRLTKRTICSLAQPSESI